MRTALAFRLPNGAFGQSNIRLIEDESARLKCDVSLERDSVGIKTPLTRLAHLFRRPHQILISDATRVTICYTDVDLADEAMEHADEAMDGHYGHRRTESETSFIQDQRRNSDLKHAFCRRIAC